MNYFDYLERHAAKHADEACVCEVGSQNFYPDVPTYEKWVLNFEGFILAELHEHTTEALKELTRGNDLVNVMELKDPSTALLIALEELECRREKNIKTGEENGRLDTESNNEARFTEKNAGRESGRENTGEEVEESREVEEPRHTETSTVSRDIKEL